MLRNWHGLSLLRLNKAREEYITSVSKKPIERTESGIVYVISNPAFPNYYKIGMTQNLERRLAEYQTYDPLRRYVVERYRVVENMRYEEKRILDEFRLDICGGEWINIKDAKKFFLAWPTGKAPDC